MKIRLSESLRAWYDGLQPTPDLSVSDWADKNRKLTSKASAEPGNWRTDRTPYLRRPMNDLSSYSPVQRVTFMKAAQIGGTEFGNNWIGYIIDHAPGSTLIVQPTVELAKLWSRQRLAPMIQDTKSIKDKIADARSRDSGNTVLLKEYDGGLLRIAGGNSAASLRSMPVKNLMLDEIDAYPYDVDGEGDPVDLAINRTKTYRRKKILEISSPTVSKISRIERSFNQGTQSYYFVPCPDCGEKQVIEFKNLKWEKDSEGEHIPSTVKLACIHCGVLIPEAAKNYMLENGEWRDSRPNLLHKSYQLSSLYSPLGWESWAEIVAKFLLAVGNDDLMKTFVNTVEGLPYQEKAKEIEPNALKQRAEPYALKVCPLGCLALTAGVDIQDNRIEIYVIGHSARAKWVIDFQIIHGSPADSDTWRELDDYLRVPFEHESGAELSISATAIDSGGHYTQQVYDFTRLRKSRHVIAVKGSSIKNKPIIGKPTKCDVSTAGRTIKNGAEVWAVGTDTAKDLIYNLLEVADDSADGFIHFSEQLSDDFYKQLTSEKKTYRYVKGFPIYEWVLPKGTRNEALDCFVYAMAAFYMMGLHRWRPAQWRQLEERIQPQTDDMFKRIDHAAREKKMEEEVKRLVPKKRKSRNRGAFTHGILNG